MGKYIRVVINDALETEFLFEKENHKTRVQKVTNDSYVKVVEKETNQTKLMVPYKNIKFVDMNYETEEGKNG